ncbi:MAG: sigma 54-interacting transcriptional regulator [Gammaproteobacteria bacterium]
MCIETTSIKLIAFGLNKSIPPIHRLTATLDTDFAVVDCNSWLQGKGVDSDSVVVLVLPASVIPADKIREVILAAPKAYYFVIFFPPVTEELASILNVCDDFCSWRCDESELEFRLNRIVSTHHRSVGHDSGSVGNDIWTELSLIGMSKEFQNVLAIIKKAAKCDAPVLIEGETGCGKEMAARAVHYLSGRKDYPFIPINCGAVPDHLIENELFGHAKGAYTDAKQSYSGAIEQADRGTLFLDEIEALSSKGQVTLLRFIEDKMLKPLGAQNSRRVDVRIVVASNASLTELVERNQFRKDLLYRLNLLYIYLPPLRNRTTDIPHLAAHFMDKYRQLYEHPDKQILPETMRWMNAYHWPGNVRELENFIHRSFLLSEDDHIEAKEPSLTCAKVQAFSRRKLIDRRLNFEFDASFSDAKNNVISHFEKQYLSWLISKTNGNVTLAADAAKKERRAMGKLLKKHDINPLRYRNN